MNCLNQTRDCEANKHQSIAIMSEIKAMITDISGFFLKKMKKRSLLSISLGFLFYLPAILRQQMMSRR